MGGKGDPPRKKVMTEPENPLGCWFCSDPPTTDEMGRCVKCLKRFHLECLGLYEETYKPDFKCPMCRQQAQETKELKEAVRKAQLEADRLKAENEHLTASIANSTMIGAGATAIRQDGASGHDEDFNVSIGNLTQGYLEATKIMKSIKDDIRENNSDEKMYGRDIAAPLLPFDGTSTTDWVRFIREFEAVSREFKFSDAINMRRLRQKCKGKAFQLIERYYLPGHYEPALAELRAEYGRSSNIIRELKLECLKRVEDAQGKLHEKLLTASLVIGNYVRGIQETLPNESIVDLEMIDSLSRRLPPYYHRRWLSKERDHEDTIALAEVRKMADCTVIVPPPLDLLDLTKFVRRAYEAEMDYEQRRLKEAAKPKKVNQAISVQVTKPESYAHVLKKGATKKPEKKDKSPIVVQESSSSKRWDYTCGFCKQKYHPGEECPKILGIPVDTRWKIVSDRENPLCNICLMGHHKASTCRSDKKCAVTNCGKSHHTLLHRESGAYHVPINV